MFIVYRGLHKGKNIDLFLFSSFLFCYLRLFCFVLGGLRDDFQEGSLLSIWNQKCCSVLQIRRIWWHTFYLLTSVLPSFDMLLVFSFPNFSHNCSILFMLLYSISFFVNHFGYTLKSIYKHKLTVLEILLSKLL